VDVRNNTVLITGGATGIGFALAEAFVRLGNVVIICGRREDKLREAKEKLPQIHIRKCDVSKEEERRSLYEWVSSNFKGINILVNNAGIQRYVDFKKSPNVMLDTDDEIEINLRALVRLSAYFIPIFSKQKESAIINISSGLGFVPMTIFPIYSATKAATHSFSMSLRHQLKDTAIRVFEIIPPIVDTELKGPKKQAGDSRAIQPSEVADSTIKALENNQYEIGIGMAQAFASGSRSDLDNAFKRING